MSKVAILGCGPAGLLAAHAVSRAGIAPNVFSLKKKSTLGGAQFLHEPIPGVTDEDPEAFLQFFHWGTDQGYASKIYGDPEAPTSWSRYEGEVPAWSLKMAYDVLWRMYEGIVLEAEVSSELMAGLFNTYDLVLSTIPPQSYCTDQRHLFSSQDVWIHEPDFEVLRDNVIIYNGEDAPPWYRASRIFGLQSVEYPQKPVGTEAFKISKPLMTTCTCFKDRLVRLGRFGMWSKRTLVHDAYRGAQDALLKM